MATSTHFPAQIATLSAEVASAHDTATVDLSPSHHATSDGAVPSKLERDHLNIAMEERNLGDDKAASASADEVDEKGRRPLAMGTNEEYFLVAALYWSMCMSSPFLLFSARSAHSSLGTVVGGWNDSSIGPLLLRIQSHYAVSYTIVSLMFVVTFVGVVMAAVSNVFVTDRFGFGKARPGHSTALLKAAKPDLHALQQVITLGAFLQAVSYAMQAPAPPLAVFLLSYIPGGIGLGLQDAQANTFVSRLPNTTSKMAWL